MIIQVCALRAQQPAERVNKQAFIKIFNIRTTQTRGGRAVGFNDITAMNWGCWHLQEIYVYQMSPVQVSWDQKFSSCLLQFMFSFSHGINLKHFSAWRLVNEHTRFTSSK